MLVYLKIAHEVMLIRAIFILGCGCDVKNLGPAMLVYLCMTGITVQQKRGFPCVTENPLDMLEATSGFEPLNNGFADHCLTTWLRRHKNVAALYTIVSLFDKRKS